MNISLKSNYLTNKTADSTNSTERNKSINKVIEALTKQKQNLLDSRNALVDRSLKNGESPVSLKEKLDSIDKQIKDIDGQISQIQIEDKRKALGSDDKSKKAEKERAKSNLATSKDSSTQRNSEQMEDLLIISQDFSKTKKLSSINKSMEGEKSILEGQIKKDIARGVNPVRKIDRVSEINELTSTVDIKIGEHLSTINSELKNSTTKAVASKEASENNSNSSFSQEQIAQNLQTYNGNLPENEPQQGEKVDAKA